MLVVKRRLPSKILVIKLFHVAKIITCSRRRLVVPLEQVIYFNIKVSTSAFVMKNKQLFSEYDMKKVYPALTFLIVLIQRLAG